ncbi:MAG: ABC transporter permease [Chloroflexi bacterium]|nr:ABC transporter permease [Chloroflexota bacterium]
MSRSQGLPLSSTWENTRRGWSKGLGRFIRRKPLGAAGGLFVLVLILTAIFAPLLATHDFAAADTARVFGSPSGEHWLGTDKFGRDVYTRIVYGSRISLAVGLGSTLLAVAVSTFLGVVSGYFLGWLDLLLQRFMDIMQGVPALILAIVIGAALEPSLTTVIIAISIPIVPRVARVIRSSALAIRGMTYVEAGRALGASHRRIMLSHILPNIMGPVYILATAQLGSAIVVEASLSFLGLGIPEPLPSWGRMLAGSATEYIDKAPWLIFMPGLAISLAVFAFNLLGDAIRDVLDPKLRGG